MKERARRAVSSAWFGPLVALILTYLLFLGLVPETFGQTRNLDAMARQTVVVAICSVGMTLVMIKGGIDLSVGSLVALTTVAMAYAMREGFSPGAAMLIGLVVGTLGGIVNGALVASLRITPFIVTLGTMSIARGAAKGVSDQQMISVDALWLEELMSTPIDALSWLLLAPGVWIALIVAGLAGGLLRFTPLGRHIVAIGSNEQTARLCGISIPRVTVFTYALAGLLAGLAGVMEFSKLTVGDPTDSIGLELDVIAAVVIGGGSLNGGQGSVPGALLGALLMTVIKTGCTYVGLPNWVQEILTGTIIVVAVALDRFRHR